MKFALLNALIITSCSVAASQYEPTTTQQNTLNSLYKHLHQNPELSYQEEKTAAKLANELSQLGFAVTENVGGYGVVGIFKNGNGS